MNAVSDEIAIVLAGRSYTYQLLKQVFGHEPSVHLLKTVLNEFTWEVLELFLDEECLVPYKELFAELNKAVLADSDATISRLKSEYVYLLIGPDKLPAPPWESVYVNKARVIFQESTLKVRKAYLEHQLLPAEYPHVADDHIAIELDFMAKLGKMCQDYFEAGDIPQTRKILTDQRDFLQNHLLVWIDEFAQQIQNSKTHHFYPPMASLTAQLLRTDLSIIEELLKE